MSVIETGYTPHAFQARIHESLKRFSVLVCHRRFGKTVLAINTLIDAALRLKRADGRFGYVAPYRNQCKSLVWDYLKRFAGAVPGVSFNESELIASFPNGARIRLFGADNAQAMRGLYFDGIVLDEVADFKPEVWVEIIRPALADRRGWALFIGTPRGLNQFSELYHHALSDPDWFGAMFPASMTANVLPWITTAELTAAKRDMSDAQYRQEFECDFGASTANTLITIDMVAAARGKHLRLDQYHRMPKILGVDVARYGDDRSVIIKRQGLATWKPAIHRGLDNMTFAGLVAQQINEWEPDAVFIDGGRGEGVIDRLRQLGYTNIIEVNFGGRALDPDRYANKRAEMWDLTREWVDQGGALADNHDLCASLVVVSYSFDAAGRLKLEPKEKLKERVGYSPDPGDALALTFAAPVRPKPTRIERRGRQAATTQSKYKVL